MRLSSKNVTHLVLGVTALIFSRVLFFLIPDPEGPNLLVVVVMAALIWCLSLGTEKIIFKTFHGERKLLVAVLIQFVVAGCLYFSLR
jgi:hypothetical protein